MLYKAELIKNGKLKAYTVSKANLPQELVRKIAKKNNSQFFTILIMNEERNFWIYQVQEKEVYLVNKGSLGISKAYQREIFANNKTIKGAIQNG
jgi:hypothetical protein